MSKLSKQPGPIRAISIALVVGLALGGVVTWLRSTAPTADVSAAFVPEAVIGPDTPLLSCAGLDMPSETLFVAGRAQSAEVLECPASFDRLTVTYIGEVVGDVLERDGGAWVLVNDDDYALITGPAAASGVLSGTNSGLSVWLPTRLLEIATTPGRAGLRGDVIKVVGKVRRADPKDGGGLTIRATEGVLLSPAVELDVPLHARQLLVAIVLAMVAGVLTIRDRRQRRR